MQHQDNEILIIQTSDSSSIIITKDLFPYDDADMESLCYSIREGDNPLYWSDYWHEDLKNIINLIEFPHKDISCKRDYISWWLNCKPTFVDEIFKPLLKQRLELYHSTGEIRNTFRHANFGLEFNSDCLIEWHKLLKVEYDQKLLELIPKEENYRFNELNFATIHFVGFQTLPYRSFSLKLDLFNNFQTLLNYIYSCIDKNVSAYSYADQWILYNSTRGFILDKGNISDNQTLKELGIRANDKIVCYKK